MANGKLVHQVVSNIHEVRDESRHIAGILTRTEYELNELEYIMDL